MFFVLSFTQRRYTPCKALLLAFLPISAGATEADVFLWLFPVHTQRTSCVLRCAVVVRGAHPQTSTWYQSCHNRIHRHRSAVDDAVFPRALQGDRWVQLCCFGANWVIRDVVEPRTQPRGGAQDTTTWWDVLAGLESISPMRPPCYSLLEETVILGVI